jgi:hypothetical protein
MTGEPRHLDMLQDRKQPAPKRILLAPCVQHDNAHGQEVRHVRCGHQLSLGAAAVQHDAEGIQAAQVQSGGEGGAAVPSMPLDYPWSRQSS